MDHEGEPTPRHCGRRDAEPPHDSLPSTRGGRGWEVAERPSWLFHALVDAVAQEPGALQRDAKGPDGVGCCWR
jgi:hypothetical protein